MLFGDRIYYAGPHAPPTGQSSDCETILLRVSTSTKSNTRALNELTLSVPQGCPGTSDNMHIESFVLTLERRYYYLTPGIERGASLTRGFGMCLMTR